MHHRRQQDCQRESGAVGEGVDRADVVRTVEHACARSVPLAARATQV